jgi:hypothetical protein
MCATECEQFIVHVRAHGDRPMLDFPDEVVFPVIPVKASLTKTILVRNVGNIRAQFKLSIGR